MLIKKLFAGLCFSFLFTGLTNAGSTSDFLSDIDSAFAHYRESVIYLRTGNVDLGAIELDEMAEKWRGLQEKYAKTRPDAFDDNAMFDATLADTGKTIDSALAAIDSGDAASARQQLLPLRAKLSSLRAASNIYTLPDCLLQAATRMRDLFAYRGKPPAKDDWPGRADVISKAAIYADTLKRCDAMASKEVRENPEFRRLFDGAIQSAERVSEAIGTGDDGLLYRLLIEMISFDRLMFYRFG